MKVVIAIDEGKVIGAQSDTEGVEVIVVEGMECAVHTMKAEFAPTAVRVTQMMGGDERLRAH